MKKIIALLLCLCLLPVYALAAETDWIVGVWTGISVMRYGQEMTMEEALGEGVRPMLVFYQDGNMFAVRISADGQIHAYDSTWRANGSAARSEDINMTLQADGTLLAVDNQDAMILRRATEEEIALIAGSVKIPDSVFAAAPAEDSSARQRYQGAWTLSSVQVGGQTTAIAEFLGEGKTMHLQFAEDGTLATILKDENGAFEEDAAVWDMKGNFAVSGTITFAAVSSVELHGSFDTEAGTAVLVLRRATDEEQAWLNNRHTAAGTEAAALPAELLGEWVYDYSRVDGERATMLEQEGDYARICIKEDWTYEVDLCIGGQPSQGVFPITKEDDGYYGNGCLLTVFSGGVLAVAEGSDVLYFTRPADAPAARRELTPTVSDQAAVSGTAADFLTGPRMTLTRFEHMATICGVSPSGRYAFGLRLLTDARLLDTATGIATPLTFNASRSAAGAALTPELLEDTFFRKLRKVAWSPDERYAALVYSGSSKDNALCDLYVLDTQSGEIFAPAAWSKDRASENYGIVQDAAFAPDGTLYFLLQGPGSVSILEGPVSLYTCSLQDHSTAKVKELPGEISSYPCLTVNGDGDVLTVIRQEDRTYALLVGAQRENMRQITIPNVYNIVPGEGGLLALQVIDSNSGAGSTVSFLDLTEPDPTLLTGLVVSAEGAVSQLPLLNKPYKDVAGGSLIYDRWREIRLGMQEGQYVGPLAAAFSPDGKQVLLACSNDSFFLLDLETLRTTPVIPGENSPKSIAFLQWNANGEIAVSTGASILLYRLEGLE